MGFDFKTWAKSWGNSWLNSWGLGQEEERAVPTVSIRKKEEFFDEELALLLYASKY